MADTFDTSWLPEEAREAFAALYKAEQAKERADAKYKKLHKELVELIREPNEGSFTAMLRLNDAMLKCKGKYFLVKNY